MPDVAANLPPSTHLVFKAFRARYEGRGLRTEVADSVTAFRAKERTDKPYLVLLPQTDEPQMRSNVTQYDRVVFVVALIGTEFEGDGEKLGTILGQFEDADMELDGGAVLRQFRQVPMNFQEIEQLFRSAVSFEAIVARPRVRRPQ